MSLAVHRLTQTTNSTTFSSYTRFYPKTFGEDKLSCPLCNFSGTSKGDLRKHYVGSFHRLKFEQETKKSAVVSLEWERKEGETERHWEIRTNLLENIGLPPQYLKTTLIKGFPAFSHSLPREHSLSWHSRTSRGEILPKPLQFAISYGEAIGHEMFCAYETSKKSRVFLSFPTFEEFWKVYISMEENAKRLHELFLPGHPTREIFDLETDMYPEGTFNERDIFEIFSKARKEFEPETDFRLFCLTSSGKEEEKFKFSIHILTDRMWNDLETMGEMFREFVKFLSVRKEYSILVELLDKGIYKKNQTIRAPWSTKSGSKRILLPLDDDIDPREYFATAHTHKFIAPDFANVVEQPKLPKNQVFEASDDFEEFLFDYCEGELDNCFDVTREGNSWRLQRREGCPCICPVCDREHEKDNMFAFEREGKLFIGCFRAEKGENTKLILKRPDAKRTAHRSLAIKKPKTDIPCLEADEVYNSASVSDFIKREGVATLIVSAMGTGKTRALVRYLSQFPDKSVLFVTYRRSLAKELWSKLEGFVHYDDVSGNMNQKRLVVQVDSLYRVTKPYYDIVVCDEATYTTSRLVRGISNTQECWSALKHYIKTAKESWFLDKNMTSSITDALQRLGVPTFVAKNEYKAHTHRTCFVSSDFVEFKESLLEDLVSGLKICFTSSSKKKLRVVCKEAEILGHSVLWYTGEGKSEDVWLENWKDYDLVAYSPTISAGVSYEERHFDKVYGFFTSRSCCAEECEQMLFRVRDIAKNEMIVCFDSASQKVPTTRKEVRDYLRARNGCSKSIPCLKWDRKTPGCPLKMSNVFTRLYVDTMVQENMSKKNISSCLLSLLKEQGVRILTSERRLSIDDKLEAVIKTKETVADIKHEDIAGISRAEKISDEEFEKLCSLRERTKEQNFKIQKWLMAHRFEMEQEDITYEFVSTYKGLEKQFFNQRLAFEGTKEQQDTKLRMMADEKNTKKQDFSEIEKLHENLTLEKVVYAKRLLKLLGFEDVCEANKIKSSEMASRIKNAREVVMKSKNFQVLFGNVSKEENLFMRWANGVLKKMFGCYIGRTSRRKNAKWHLLFSAPWNHNGKTPETKAKVSEGTKIPVVWKT
ncbi:putative replication origin-binding protein [Port-miou virus]|uniref:Putative replication origin-binding protein n=1 Tax=Port-miou virus TaxID=1733873 RepID=A0A0N9Q0X0_9VIRU|nr:putative replication origin-binding protein [Port-miou virus]